MNLTLPQTEELFEAVVRIKNAEAGNGPETQPGRNVAPEVFGIPTKNANLPPEEAARIQREMKQLG